MSSSLLSKIRASAESSMEREDFEASAFSKAVEDGEMQLLNHFPDLVKIFRPDELVSNLGPSISALFKFRREIEQKRQQFPGFGNTTTGILSGGGGGFFQHFEHGSIFWTEMFGAHVVYGAIRDKYASLGWERSYLGYPTTDELSTQGPRGETRYNNFENGSIWWTANRGAFVPLTLRVWIEPHQLGAWVHLGGAGFTPGSTVRFSVEGLEGMVAPKTTGTMAFPKADGTFDGVVWDGRTWTRGGNARIRAHDEALRESVAAPIPALH